MTKPHLPKSSSTHNSPSLYRAYQRLTADKGIEEVIVYKQTHKQTDKQTDTQTDTHGDAVVNMHAEGKKNTADKSRSTAMYIRKSFDGKTVDFR